MKEGLEWKEGGEWTVEVSTVKKCGEKWIVMNDEETPGAFLRVGVVLAGL